MSEAVTATRKLRILVPVDGSQNAERAVAHAIALVKAGQAGELHLLNVQRPVSGGVATFVGQAPIKEFHREEGMKALAPAIALCEQAGVPCVEHIGVGAPGQTIAAFVDELGCDQVIMGTHGFGTVSRILMGSVSHETIHQMDPRIPVTLIKASNAHAA